MNIRILSIYVLVLISMLFLQSCKDKNSDEYLDKMISAIPKNTKIVYPDEKLFKVILEWLNQYMKNVNKIPQLWGNLSLNEFSNYKYSHADHSFVTQITDGKEFGIHMKIFIADIYNNNNMEIMIYENAGTLKYDNLLCAFSIIGNKVVNDIELPKIIHNIPMLITLQKEPFTISENGKVRINYFEVMAKDKAGNEIGPNRQDVFSSVTTYTSVEFDNSVYKTFTHKK